MSAAELLLALQPKLSDLEKKAHEADRRNRRLQLELGERRKTKRRLERVLKKKLALTEIEVQLSNIEAQQRHREISEGRIGIYHRRKIKER